MVSVGVFFFKCLFIMVEILQAAKLTKNQQNRARKNVAYDHVFKNAITFEPIIQF